MDFEKLGQKIKDARIDKNLSQEAVGLLIGVSGRTVSLFEMGLHIDKEKADMIIKTIEKQNPSESKRKHYKTIKKNTSNVTVSTVHKIKSGNYEVQAFCDGKSYYIDIVDIVGEHMITIEGLKADKKGILYALKAIIQTIEKGIDK